LRDQNLSLQNISSTISRIRNKEEEDDDDDENEIKWFRHELKSIEEFQIFYCFRYKLLPKLEEYENNEKEFLEKNYFILPNFLTQRYFRDNWI